MARLTRIIEGPRAGGLRSNGIVGIFSVQPTIGQGFLFESTGFDDPDCGRIIRTSAVTKVTIEPNGNSCFFETKSGSTYLLEIDYEPDTITDGAIDGQTDKGLAS